MKAFLKEHKFYLSILAITGLVVMIFTGFYTNKLSHDIGFHVNNIENLSEHLDFSKGRFLAPDISEKIGGNLGYGLYLFYPSLPHLLYAYFYKFISLFSIDILTSNLILSTILTLVSTFFMYLLSYKLSKNKRVSFLTGLLFIVFPYRISNLFMRYALNESLLFLFIPLVLLGLYEWKEKNFKSFYIYFTIGYIGMFYSHLLMTFYFTLLMLPFAYFYRKEVFKKKFIIPLLKGTLFVTIFISPILVSFLEHVNGDYLVYLPYYMTSPALVLHNTMDFSSYFFLNLDDWAVQTYIPILIIFLLLVSIIWLLKKHKKNRFYMSLFVSTLLCVLLTMPFFPWRKLPDMFLMIQFPWRLMTFMLVFISLYAPICLLSSKRGTSYIVLFLSVFILTESTPLLYHIRERKYEITDDYLSIELAAGNMGEYFPTEYYEKKNTYYYSREKEGIVIVNRKGLDEVEKLRSSFPNLRFSLKNAKDTELEFPRIYYKGYELRKGGKKYKLSRSENGLLKADLTEDGVYTLFYRKTLLKRCVIYFKYGFLFLMGGYFIYRKFKDRKVTS